MFLIQTLKEMTNLYRFLYKHAFNEGMELAFFRFVFCVFLKKNSPK